MAGTLTIQWPVQSASITSAYAPGAGITIAAPQGTAIKAGAAGRVVVVTADTVQIASEQYVVTYRNLQNIKFKGGEQVNIGDVLGEAASADGIKLMVHQELDPTPLLVAQETTPPAGQVIYVRPKTDGLRIRETPINGKVVGQIYLVDAVESLESAEATKQKIGVNDQWLQIKGLDGKPAYAAAWLLEIAPGPPAKPTIPVGAANITGMNLDLFHPLGHPDPARLKGMGWVRFLYNVSYNPDNNSYGNTDIQATYNRYKPMLEKYASVGLKVLLVFTHQTYGEGQGYMWNQMDAGKWRDLTSKFADMLKRIAQQYKGQNIVHAFQIWNEMDAHEGAEASVTLPPTDYANMLAETIKAVRSVDPNLLIITGGHTGGPVAGSKYARNTINAMPAGIRPDGIACHPYGRGAPESDKRYMHFGLIDEEIDAYSRVMPDKAVWITEWGVLNAPNEKPGDISKYASEFVKRMKGKYNGKVASAMWYAWAQGMHNGYGLVAENDQPRDPFYRQFLGL
jgi:hypothetical protein